MSGLLERIAAARERARARGLGRRAPRVERQSGVRYRVDGHDVVGFCSNDYLGLASAARTFTAPSGASASRLVCGDHPATRSLEASLARMCGAADAVLFPSGYQLNLGCLPVLLDANDTVHSDRLAHASLIDGMRLSPARPIILPHNTAPPTDSSSWWVTESVFSMDGDGPTSDDLTRHLSTGLLYLDEAHAFGLHERGLGRAAAHGLAPTASVVTFGKALGASGAALIASAEICEHVRTTARSFVYSTGVSPLTCAAIAHNLDHVRSDAGDELRAKLWSNVRSLRTLLELPQQRSPIVPLIVGSAQTAVEASRRLLERGFHVQAIRPPTVPAGTARLRITLSAAHETEQVRRLADALRDLLPAQLASAS